MKSSKAFGAPKFDMPLDCYSDSSTLNHSAAKHKIAIRPKDRRRPAKAWSKAPSSPSVCSVSLSMQLTSTNSWIGSELNYSSSNSPEFLPRNANVTFGCSLPSSWETHSAVFPSCFSSSSDSGNRTGESSRANNGHERFLSSIEHWTLANEGLKRAISNLNFTIHPNPTPQIFTSNSLESICSGLMNFESMPSHLNSLAESSDCLLLFSRHPDQIESESAQDDVGCGKSTCDGEKKVPVETSNEMMTSKQDELEHVNVKEMRKLFLFTPISRTISPSFSAKNTNVGFLEYDHDFSELPRSFVKSIVMKFENSMSCPNL